MFCRVLMQKKQKPAIKAEKWLRKEMQLCRDIITALSGQSPKGRSLSQQAELCCNKDKAECKMTFERLSQHNMRRSIRNMLQHRNECHNIIEV